MPRSIPSSVPGRAARAASALRRALRPASRLALPVVVLGTLGTAGLAASAPSSAGAETASGTVFLDRDADGVRDRGEPGLANVAVSNGRDVVETDAEGRWTIEDVRDGDVLFVVKPRDHQFLLDDHHRPRFFHVHRPEGTPEDLDLRYPGIPPTGALPSSIDFALVESPEPDRFDVLLLADTQPQSHVELDHLREDVLQPLVGTDAAFGMTLGDVLYDDLSLFPRYVELVGRIGIPWYDVPGNHELNMLAPDDARSLETFVRWVGPTTYSFDHGPAHFVVLDDVVYRGTRRGQEGADARGTGGYHGGFTEEQMLWLERDLARIPEERLVVVAMHIPLRSHLGPDSPQHSVLERGRLFEILSRRPHVLALAGHTHVVEHHWFDEDDGWSGSEPLHQHVLAAASGSWWTGPRDARGVPDALQRDGVPNGWSVLTVDGHRATVRYRAAGSPPEHQMRIGFDRLHHQLGDALLDDYRPGEMQFGPLRADELPATEVYVNLFNGGPRSEVWMRIGAIGPWTPMERRTRRDPFVVEYTARNLDTMKGWVRPVPTGHLWWADLPEQLAPGAHVLHVRARDEYGAEHTGRRIFEVLD